MEESLGMNGWELLPAPNPSSAAPIDDSFEIDAQSSINPDYFSLNSDKNRALSESTDDSDRNPSWIDPDEKNWNFERAIDEQVNHRAENLGIFDSDLNLARSSPFDQRIRDFDRLVDGKVSPRAENLRIFDSDLNFAQSSPSDERIRNFDGVIHEKVTPKSENLGIFDSDLNIARRSPFDQRIHDFDQAIDEKVGPRAVNLGNFGSEMDFDPVIDEKVSPRAEDWGNFNSELNLARSWPSDERNWDFEGVIEEKVNPRDKNLGKSVGLRWWKVPIEFLKFCVLRIRPSWSVSFAAALVGIVLLKKRFDRRRNNSRRVPVSLGFEDKKSSLLLGRASQLNEVVKQVPMIRPMYPTMGATPFPLVAWR